MPNSAMPSPLSALGRGLGEVPGCVLVRRIPHCTPEPGEVLARNKNPQSARAGSSLTAFTNAQIRDERLVGLFVASISSARLATAIFAPDKYRTNQRAFVVFG